MEKNKTQEKKHNKHTKEQIDEKVVILNELCT